MRKNKYIILMLILTLSTMVLMGCGAKMPRNQEEAVEDFEYQAVPVKLESVISDAVYQSIYTIGEIKASEQYEVKAMTNGDVLEVFYSVGDFVEEGDVLFTIEAKDFEVDKSISLTQASNAISQTKISYDSATENYEKYKTLFENGVASQAELDNVENQFENAKISYNNALQSYQSVKHNYDTMGENYEITSPASGLVVSKNVTEGMFATAQNGFVIDVVEEYIISSQIASKHVNNVKEGQDVELYISTLDILITGVVDSVSQSGMNGLYPIDIKLNKSSSTLKPGMYADIWIFTNKSSEGLWIPNKAILQENGESFVYTVVDGKAKKIIVNVLSTRGDNAAVKSELSKDSEIITFGKEYVLDGSPVEVK